MAGSFELSRLGGDGDGDLLPENGERERERERERKRMARPLRTPALEPANFPFPFYARSVCLLHGQEVVGCEDACGVGSIGRFS